MFQGKSSVCYEHKGYGLPACTLWTDRYLVDVMGEQAVSVAVTPNGYVHDYITRRISVKSYRRADAIARGSDNMQYFTEPMIVRMSIMNLLASLAKSR